MRSCTENRRLSVLRCTETHIPAHLLVDHLRQRLLLRRLWQMVMDAGRHEHWPIKLVLLLRWRLAQRQPRTFNRLVVMHRRVEAAMHGLVVVEEELQSQYHISHYNGKYSPNPNLASAMNLLR
jgi:hypothetical protein